MSGRQTRAVRAGHCVLIQKGKGENSKYPKRLLINLLNLSSYQESNAYIYIYIYVYNKLEKYLGMKNKLKNLSSP
jgi:hypothetical protein